MFQETDLKALKDVASKRGDDGKKILEETYDRAFRFQVRPLRSSLHIDTLATHAEIKEVLAKQSEKAKKLGEKAAEDAKK